MSLSDARVSRLDESANRWRSALKSGDCGPLAIAQEVDAISNVWEKYREEAGGLDCTSWLRKNLGKDLAFFQRRASAVEKLGEAIRRTFHHETAVWVASHFDGDAARGATFAIMSVTKNLRGNCLNVERAKRVVFKALKMRPESVRKPCARCAELEEKLRKNGIEV